MISLIKRSVFFLRAPRLIRAWKASRAPVGTILRWTFSSRETSTYTFQLEDRNREYLIQAVSIVTGKPFDQVEKYFLEAENDNQLSSYVIERIRKSGIRYKKDLRCDFGSRIAWYAIIRCNRSSVVVENGVEMGYNAALLCTALLRNLEEGFPGKYYGLDINPEAGYLVNDARFDKVRVLLTDDAISSINRLEQKVDFYFSDGIRTKNYEVKEFDALEPKLSAAAVVVTNKLGMSNALSEHAVKTSRKLLFFQEQPKDHWYPGSALGIMYSENR
jgi:predicted O-methyltransferase YrrM